MKKTIDNSSPPEYGFLMNRKKKEILEHGKNTEVIRNNKIMVTKIESIMKHRSSSSSLHTK